MRISRSIEEVEKKEWGNEKEEADNHASLRRYDPVQVQRVFLSPAPCGTPPAVLCKV